MGLLDDAIKEHLDLKRRRGADPTEIERLEREALGPVRRVAQEPPPAEESGLELTHAAEHAHPAEELDPGVEYEHDHESAYEYVEDHEDEYAPEEPSLAPESGAYQAEPEPPRADVPETHGIVPPPEPMPAEPPEHPGLGVETAEYDVEAEHGEDDEGEDMLEETPEFLQDAPDHDRLWFEQRPPKDFDFDG